jgi:hypothetical protein
MKKPWFDEECLELANKRKQTKLLWLQNPNNQTAEDFSNVRRDNCIMSRKRKRDYMKAKFKNLEENSKDKNIREMYKGIIEFKKGYQPCAYVIKKYDGITVADTTSTLSRWKRFFSNLLNVNQSTSRGGSEVYTAEPDIPEPSLIEVQLAKGKLKRHKATGVYSISSEHNARGGGKLYE